MARPQTTSRVLPGRPGSLNAMSDQTRTLPTYAPPSPPAPYDGWPRSGTPGSPETPHPPSEQQPPQHPAPVAAAPRRGVGLLAAVALAAGLLGGGTGAALTALVDDGPGTSTSAGSLSGTPTSTDSPPADGSVEQVAAAVLPSVVSIRVATAEGGGEGTGVVLSSDGLILTNNHVVAAAATGGRLTVAFEDGSTTPASLVGRDPVTDLAVVRAEGVSGLTEATLGRSADLDPGEQVVAIGSPLGLEGTVTSGIVSALNRPVRTGGASSAETDSTVIDAIQTDAAINPGNSGGPLVNLRGEVVGINSAIASLGSRGGQAGSIGLGFSIPVDQARVIAEELIDSGSATHAQLGVSVQDAESGAAVAKVSPGGSAVDAGLQVGDVISAVGDRTVDGADSLIATIRSHRPGDQVPVTYSRDGEESTLSVTLGTDT